MLFFLLFIRLVLSVFLLKLEQNLGTREKECPHLPPRSLVKVAYKWFSLKT